MKCRTVLWFLLLFSFFLLLLFEPTFASEAAFSRLSFFVRAIFPSLFVSLCLSGMLVSMPPVRTLYRFPFGVEITVLLLGIFCGFPVGARSAMLLYEEGKISKNRAEFLCGFSNLASLPFLIGVVGNSLFGNVSFGVHLAILQTASALFAGMVLFPLLRPDCRGVESVAEPTAAQPLSRAVSSSAHTMLELGGMIVFFGVAADSIEHFIGLHGWQTVLVQGLLEFSSGCESAAEYSGEVGRLLAVLSVGCSGLCVMSQVSAVTKGKLSLRPYLLGKLIQCAFMTVLTLLL